jgi:hypothetical protein
MNREINFQLIIFSRHYSTPTIDPRIEIVPKKLEHSEEMGAS